MLVVVCHQGFGFIASLPPPKVSIFASKGCSNAHGELPAAVPLVPLRQKLCFSPPLFIPEQDGEGAAQEPDGT